jgi:hypothetical protein
LELVRSYGSTKLRLTPVELTVGIDNIYVNGEAVLPVECRLKDAPCGPDDTGNQLAQFTLPKRRKGGSRATKALTDHLNSLKERSKPAEADAGVSDVARHKRLYSALNITVDRRIPYRMLVELLPSIYESGFTDMRFVVDNGNQRRVLPLTTLPVTGKMRKAAKRVKSSVSKSGYIGLCEDAQLRRGEKSKPLQLTLHVLAEKQKGLKLSWKLREKKGKELNKMIPKILVDNELCSSLAGESVDGACQAYDYKSLYMELLKVKASYPLELNLYLLADSTVPFDVVARAMDVVQCRRSNPKETSLSGFMQTERSAQCDPLFPFVFFAVAK